MRQYKASGIAPFTGVFFALIAGLIAAIVMGGVLYAVEHYTGFYIIILFPAFAGIFAGLALVLAVKLGKIRNSTVAAMLGAIAAIALVATYHYGKYQLEFKDDARQFQTSSKLKVTDVAVDEITDEYLKSETGTTGFVGFLQLEAQQGISITRSFSRNGLELKGFWYWLYTAIEFAIVLVIIAMLGWASASEPFNELRAQWYGRAQVILTAPSTSAYEIGTGLNNSQYAHVGALLQRDPLPPPRVEITVKQTAIKDPDNVIVTVNLVEKEGKHESRTQIVSGLMTQAQLERMLSRAVVSLEPAAG